MRIAKPSIAVYSAKEILEMLPRAFPAISSMYEELYIEDDWYEGAESEMFRLSGKQADKIGRSHDRQILSFMELKSFELQYPYRHLSVCFPKMSMRGFTDLFQLAGLNRSLSGEFRYKFAEDSPKSRPRLMLDVEVRDLSQGALDVKFIEEVCDRVSKEFDKFVDAALDILDTVYAKKTEDVEICKAMEGVEFTSDGAVYHHSRLEEDGDE